MMHGGMSRGRGVVDITLTLKPISTDIHYQRYVIPLDLSRGRR
jgi:hypothetical protein